MVYAPKTQAKPEKNEQGTSHPSQEVDKKKATLAYTVKTNTAASTYPWRQALSNLSPQGRAHEQEAKGGLLALLLMAIVIAILMATYLRDRPVRTAVHCCLGISSLLTLWGLPLLARRFHDVGLSAFLSTLLGVVLSVLTLIVGGMVPYKPAGGGYAMAKEAFPFIGVINLIYFLVIALIALTRKPEEKNNDHGTTP